MSVTKGQQIQAAITESLAALNPSILEVVNESHKHHGHAGDDGSGATHYYVRIASHSFNGKSRIACHRMVYDALGDIIGQPVHALRIDILKE